MEKKFFGLPALSAATLLAAVVATPLQAATVTFEYTESFGAVPPAGPPPAGNTDIITPGTARPNQLRAGSDGIYDILFDFPPPPGQQAARFNAGESLVYDISGIAGLTADSFNFFSEPGPGSTAGPFLSVARFQDTPGGGSDWVGAVPVPAAVWLFGSGLLGLVGIARKRRG